MDVFIGTIFPFAFNFPPSGWAFCNGQTLQVAQYQALYALIYTYYGGSGSNFNLPNLCGRMPIGMGQAAPSTTGYTYFPLAGTGGQETQTLQTKNLPTIPVPDHTHGLNGVSVDFQVAGVATPAQPTSAPSTTNNCLGASGGGTGLANIWSTTLNSPVYVQGLSISGETDSATAAPTPGNYTPFSLLPPYLALNFCIAVMGLFPTHD
jgi:microcystin-dependent protein